MLKSKGPNRIIFFVIASLAVHIALVITVSLYHRKKTLEMEPEQAQPMTVFVEQIEEPPTVPEEEPLPEEPPEIEQPQPEPAPAEEPPQEPPYPAGPEPDRELPEHTSPAQEQPHDDAAGEPDAAGESGPGASSSGNGTAGSGRGSGPSMEDRFADLLARIERYKSGAYPLSARKLGLEGTVVVRLTLDASGALTSLSVVEECPYRSLNEAAVELVRRVLRKPYDHGLGYSVRLTIPIIFKLD